jgi:MFS family permease
LPLWEPAWLWIVLYGIAVAPVLLAIQALPGEVLPPASRATGFGVFYTLNYLGFATLPALAGYLLDRTGSTAAPLWFSGLLFLLIVPTLLLFRRLHGRTAPGAGKIEDAPPGSTSPVHS